MTTESPHWSTGALHSVLVSALPAYVKEPFSAAPKLAVLDVAKAICMSHERVYTWLRTNRLTPSNAKKLVELVNTEGNVAALHRLGRKPVKVEDFSRFVFA